MSIAFRIPAEPGWRAVTITETTEPPDDVGERTAAVGFVPVVTWAVHSDGLSPRMPAHCASLGVILPAKVVSYGGMITLGGLDLWALDADGKGIEQVVRIVPPDGPDNDALEAEIKAWIAEVNAAVRAKRSAK